MTEERITSSTGGQKCSKPARFDLLDSSFLWKVAEVMGYGCGKYAPHNWRRGYDWGLSMAACQRHLHQFWQGEDDDQESGLPHLSHACFHLMALYCFSQGIQYRQFDGRFLPEMDLTLTPDGEVVTVPDLPPYIAVETPDYLKSAPASEVEIPDFPRGVAHETIPDLDRALSDTAEMPVVRMCPDRSDVLETDFNGNAFRMWPDSHGVFQTDCEVVARLRQGYMVGDAYNEMAARRERARRVGDRMAEVLAGLQEQHHERPE